MRVDKWRSLCRSVAHDRDWSYYHEDSEVLLTFCRLTMTLTLRANDDCDDLAITIRNMPALSHDDFAEWADDYVEHDHERSR